METNWFYNAGLHIQKIPFPIGFGFGLGFGIRNSVFVLEIEKIYLCPSNFWL